MKSLSEPGMPYLIDRERALRASEIVAILSVRQRRVRSRVVLRDNSLYQTLTRPGTLRRYANISGEAKAPPDHRPDMA